MAKKGQKFINYSVEFKLLAVNKYLEGEMAYKACFRKCMGDGNPPELDVFHLSKLRFYCDRESDEISAEKRVGRDPTAGDK
ncbi:hypothetical protein [Bacillus smithii]|uniref:hypothetical protein n=1 Tax=Bacillus smithii TaxID=1479 RepID=UPI003D210C2B